WLQELQQPFNPDGLPCGLTVVGINLTPATATRNVGQTHTVTATLTDQLGAPRSGILVSFQVLSGPNAGASGTCNPASCVTPANGQVSFTYTGSGGVGTDNIRASFVNSSGQTIFSQTVTVTWVSVNRPPTANPDGPYTVPEGGTVMLSSAGSDPDGDPITFA